MPTTILRSSAFAIRLSEPDRAEFLEEYPEASIIEPMPGKALKEYVAAPPHCSRRPGSSSTGSGGAWVTPALSPSRRRGPGRSDAVFRPAGVAFARCLQGRSAIRPRQKGEVLPRCIAGRRSFPPEDCGGPWGYQELLAALGDPAHPDHESMKEWVGPYFEPEVFDLEHINSALALVAWGREPGIGWD